MAYFIKNKHNLVDKGDLPEAMKKLSLDAEKITLSLLEHYPGWEMVEQLGRASNAFEEWSSELSVIKEIKELNA